MISAVVEFKLQFFSRSPAWRCSYVETRTTFIHSQHAHIRSHNKVSLHSHEHIIISDVRGVEARNITITIHELFMILKPFLLPSSSCSNVVLNGTLITFCPMSMLVWNKKEEKYEKR